MASNDGSSDDALRPIAVELYGTTPSAFVAARNARAAEATAAGDRALAGRIRSLAKPTVAVWAVGALVRHRADDVDALLELGERMREAGDPSAGVDRDALRDLGRERQRMLGRLGDEARALGDELGVAVSPAAAVDVEQTLQAALGDPRAAAVVRSGLLTRILAPAGFGEVDLDGALPAGLDELVLEGLPAATPNRPLRAVPKAGELRGEATADSGAGDTAAEAAAGAGAGKTPTASAPREPAPARRGPGARERARAEAAREAEETRQDAEDAANEVAALDLRADELRDRRARIDAELRDLKHRVEELTDQLGDTTSEAAFLRRTRAAAQRTADAARRAADRARTRLDRLDD